MRVVRRRAALAAAILSGLGSSPVSAHSPIEGLGTFYSYFLHPVLVPEFALLVLGVTLLLGQQGRDAARIGLAGLTLGLVAGLLLIGIWPTLATDQRLILLMAMIAGAALCADKHLPKVIPAILAFGCGLAVTLDPDLAMRKRDALLAASGLVIGTLFFATIVTGYSIGSEPSWLQIARRVIGSWIVAAAMLVLALALKASI